MYLSFQVGTGNGPEWKLPQAPLTCLAHMYQSLQPEPLSGGSHPSRVQAGRFTLLSRLISIPPTSLLPWCHAVPGFEAEGGALLPQQGRELCSQLPHLSIWGPCCAPLPWTAKSLGWGTIWKLYRSGATRITQLLSSKEDGWYPQNTRHVFGELNLEPA